MRRAVHLPGVRVAAPSHGRPMSLARSAAPPPAHPAELAPSRARARRTGGRTVPRAGQPRGERAASPAVTTNADALLVTQPRGTSPRSSAPPRRSPMPSTVARCARHPERPHAIPPAENSCSRRRGAPPTSRARTPGELPGRSPKRRNPVERGFCRSHLPDSNRRPADYESAALPTELRWRVRAG